MSILTMFDMMAMSLSWMAMGRQVPEVVGAAVEVLAQLSSMTLEAESCFPEEFREQKLSEMRRGDEEISFI